MRTLIYFKVSTSCLRPATHPLFIELIARDIYQTWINKVCPIWAATCSVFIELLETCAKHRRLGTDSYNPPCSSPIKRIRLMTDTNNLPCRGIREGLIPSCIYIYIYIYIDKNMNPERLCQSCLGSRVGVIYWYCSAQKHGKVMMYGDLAFVVLGLVAPLHTQESVKVFEQNRDSHAHLFVTYSTRWD
jgi:hypothetical protein